MTFSVTLTWGQIFKLTFSGQLIGYSTRLPDVIFLWPMTSQDGKQGQIAAVYNAKHFIKVTYHLKETTKRWYLFSQGERGKYRRYYSRLLSVPNKCWKKIGRHKNSRFLFFSLANNYIYPLADPGGGIRGICPPRQEPGEGIQYKYAPPVQTYTSYAYNEELNKNWLESLPSN